MAFSTKSNKRRKETGENGCYYMGSAQESSSGWETDFLVLSFKVNICTCDL